jgi:hypothetical protein
VSSSTSGRGHEHRRAVQDDLIGGVGASLVRVDESRIAEELAELVCDGIDVVAERSDSGIETAAIEVTDDARSHCGVLEEFFEGVPVYGEHH